MWSGRIAKAGRGELTVPLPIGFVRRPSGEVALDPDEQVQAVVRLVFDALPAAGHDRGGAGLSGRFRHPVGRAAAGGGPSAASWSGGGRAGTRWPTCCVTGACAGIYAYAPEHGGPQTAAGGPPVHRTGAPRARQLAGVP